MLSIFLPLCPARADVVLLVEEPINLLGHIASTGHTALLLTMLCSDDHLHLRPCRSGEPGTVIGRYQGLASHHAAYLFDLDGTVADSMPIHFLAWSRSIREHGGQFPEQLFYDLGGVPPLRVVEILNERFGTQMDPYTVVPHKESLYLEALADLKPVASVLEVLERDHGTVPFAIVSGSPRDSIERTLAHLGLAHYFPLLVGAEDYTHGKPAPESFLTAARILGVDPARCLVFEDAEAGIQSAVAAGMQYVRIPAPALASAG